MEDLYLNLNSEQLKKRIPETRHTAPDTEKKMAYRLLEIAENDYDRACAYMYISDASLTMLHFKDTVKFGELSIKKFEGYEDDYMSAMAHNILASAYNILGETQKALGNYIEGLETAAKIKNNILTAAIYNNIGDLYLEAGGYDEALDLYLKGIGKAEKSYINSGNIRYTDNSSYYRMLQLYIRKGDMNRAWECFENADRLAAFSDSKEDRLSHYMFLISLYDAQQDTDKVEKYLNEVMEFVDEIAPSASVYLDVCKACKIATHNKLLKEAEYFLKRLEMMTNEIDCENVYKQYYETYIGYARLIGDEALILYACRNYYNYTIKLDKKVLKSEKDIINSAIQLGKRKAENKVLEQRKEKLMDNVFKDALTGIYNRAGFKRYAEEVFSGSVKAVGVIMIDVDYFKEYNDTYGHPAGDMCLKHIADSISSAVEKHGAAARYGGDEFIAFLNDITYNELEETVRKIRQNIADCKIANSGSEVSDYVTVSIGAVYDREHKEYNLLDYMHYADRRLYEVKNNEKGGYMLDIL